MLFQKNGEKVTLWDLPAGTMFSYTSPKGYTCIALKSEYFHPHGGVEAVILGSGEFFWGDAHTAKELNQLMVQPLELIEE